jgi:murein L,D-transpeptidase YcbB/YkuD
MRMQTQLLSAVLIGWCGVALAQSPNPAPTAKPPVPAGMTNARQPAPQAKSASLATPDSRSAAALALTREPTFDAGAAQRIREAALSYADVAVRGGWPTVPPDANFVLGGSGPNVDLLRRRLLISGDLATDGGSGPYDEILAEAVKRFQLRHGLAATGLITPRTLEALNVPVRTRIQQLESSLARLQNMNFAFGERYVVVNIPAAYVEAVENDKVVRRYRAIVGKTEKPSPTLVAEITNVNLNPTWTVPPSITKNEIVERMRKDPNYLARMHMQVLDSAGGEINPNTVDWSSSRDPNFMVRQESGSWNALGAVRIDMPNSYSVYMHDTNQRSLFADDYRFDSHGCTRVDNVRDLAAWLLRDDPKWSRSEIDAAIATGQRLDIRMPKNVPVAWTYLTAWMTRDETVQFRKDVYSHDEQLADETAEELAFNDEMRNAETAQHQNPMK